MEEGFLTEEQIGWYKDTFSSFDRSGRGNVDIKELKGIMDAIDERLTDAELQDVISTIDVDGNGTLDFPEFLQLMARKLMKRTFSSDIGNVFAMFDNDGNGYITAEELRLVLTNLGHKMSEEEIDEMIHDVDTDGSGTIDYEEFVRFMTYDL